MCVLDNGKEVIVNTNDCPYEIAHRTSFKVKDLYKNIDLLLVGYSGASAYPHCYELTQEEKNIEAEKKKNLRLTDAKKYIELFQPKYFLPFAGRYTLEGKLYSLNGDRGEPELEEAYDYLITVIDQHKNKAILLNPVVHLILPLGMYLIHT
jgi:UDP-MurNAc hydroxylase